MSGRIFCVHSLRSADRLRAGGVGGREGGGEKAAISCFHTKKIRVIGQLEPELFASKVHRSFLKITVVHDRTGCNGLSMFEYSMTVSTSYSRMWLAKARDAVPVVSLQYV